MEDTLEKDSPEGYFNGIERFDGFVAEADRRKAELDRKIYALTILACNIFDDLSQKRLYSFKMGFETRLDKARAILDSSKKRHLTRQVMDDLDFKMYHTVTVGAYPLETRQVTINGEICTAIQLGYLIYPQYDRFVFRPVVIQGRALKKLSFSRKLALLEIPVYFPEDVLKRIMERSGYIVQGLCILDLVAAFDKPESRRFGLHAFMITFLMNGLKIGYLIAELIDGILVITDFLLMTDKNTSEGDMLRKSVRRKKFGAEYVAIDNIPALMRTDLLENEAVCKLFHDAGCQSLLDMCTRMNDDDGTEWRICLDKDDDEGIDINDFNLHDFNNNDEFIEE